MSLPLPVIDRIFERLVTAYGREFMARWDGMDDNAVKSAWADALSGYVNNLEAIGYALEHLPERAPNLVVFKNLCLLAPAKDVPKLEAPKADPVIVAHIMQGLQQKERSKPKDDGRGWARRILENQKGRTQTVIAMAKAALGAV